MAQGKRTQKNSRDNYRGTYIDGNTVRWEQAVPARELPERTHKEIMRDRERRQAARRNRTREQAMSRGYVIFLTVMILVCAGICTLYIHLQSNVTTHMSSIAALETQLTDLKADNDATENRIQSSMTMDEIKARAAELGLAYPTSEQLQQYTVDSSDYMNQY